MVDLLRVYERLEPLEPKSTALVLLDLQKICIEQWCPRDSKDLFLSHISELLAWARNLNLQIIHVKVGFRAGYPEISASNRLFSKLAKAEFFNPSSEGCEFHDAAKPDLAEAVVQKHRVGAFTGTDLDMILRSRGTKTIIFGGLTTTGALLSAVRQAFDLDYQMIVPSDCCTDSDQSLHEMVLGKIIAHHATVTTLKNLKADSVAG